MKKLTVRSGTETNFISVEVAPCEHCNERTPLSLPKCSKCGCWQSWGDEAVERLRAYRLHRFLRLNRKAESFWKQERKSNPRMRGDLPTLKAPTQGWLWRVRRSLHLFLIAPRRAFWSGFATALLLIVVSWGVIAVWKKTITQVAQHEFTALVTTHRR